MKKVNLMALATIVMALASCSQSDDIAGQPAENLNEGLEPIQLNVSNPYSASLTRGTGVVGGLTENDNVWRMQHVNIYMLNRGTTEFAYFNQQNMNAGIPIYAGADFVTPNGVVSDIASAADGSIKYYPPSGNFDFWGYRLDDCVAEDAIVYKDSIVIPFTLDGSQDIMVGKAMPTANQLATASQQAIDRVYSAYAARNGVQPDITFKHLLTRLTFQAQARSSNVCDQEQGVYIDSVQIKTVAGARLTVAFTDAANISNVNEQIKFTGDSVYLYLKDSQVDEKGNLKKLEPVLPTWNFAENRGDSVKIGESLMISAGDKYELLFFVRQSKPSQVGGQAVPIYYQLPYTLTTDPNSTTPAPFLPGYSYNVLLSINGLQDIVITATLEKWGDGGTINISPEDDM